MILVVLLLLLAPVVQASTNVSADSITLHAADLPEFKSSPCVPGPEGNQISWVVRRMLQDRREHLWFATQNGVCRHDGTSLVNFDLRDEYKQRVTATALAEDREGNLWIAAEGGVYKHDGQTLSRVRVMEDDSETFVTGIVFDGKGNTWFGTCHKGMIWLDTRQREHGTGTAGDPQQLPALPGLQLPVRN